MAEEKVFAVFGLGTFGFEVCQVLADSGEKVIAIDNTPRNIERIKDTVSKALLLDSTDAETLAEAPLEDVDVAIVAMGDDLQASILTTAVLKNMGIPYIVARSVSEIHSKVLRQIGANEIVNPEIEEGSRLALRLVSPDVLATIPLNQDYSIAEMYVPSDLIDKPFYKTEIIRENRLQMIAVERRSSSVDDLGNPLDKSIMLRSEADDVFKADDVLFLFGRNSDIEKFKDLY